MNIPIPPATIRPGPSCRPPISSLGLLTLMLILIPAWAAEIVPESTSAAALAQQASAVRKLATLGVRHIVFANRTVGQDGHWYANFGYRGADEKQTLYGTNGRLSILDLASGTVRTLLEDRDGAVRDPQVSYDGTTILFSYRKGTSANFLLYTISTDGSNLRQLTYGIYDDFEPTYVADGGILFVSSRSRRWVNCLPAPVATIFRCDQDGRNIRPLSANVEQDNTPWPLPDGRIIYTRWEYIDRSQMVYHHLWVMRPDGSGQMVYYGNYQPGFVFCDAKPIPGTNEVIGTFSHGRHGDRDHGGSIARFREDLGPDDRKGMTVINKGLFFDPYPLASDAILVSDGKNLLLMDEKGSTVNLYASRDRAQLYEPRPVMARQRERIIPSAVDLTKATGTIVVQNTYLGRAMEGLAPGEVKKVLILDNLPKPSNRTNTPCPLTVSSTFQLNRILGEVPVEADGSIHAEVPANRSLQLVLLDGQNRSLKRMQSFFTVMPGERSACIGCHENRREAPAAVAKRVLALNRPPSVPVRPAHIPEIISYHRDIQPILDRNCISCHDNRQRSGGINLSGDRGPVWSLSYYELSVRGQFFVGGNLEKSSYPPKTIGDSVSPLLWKMTAAEHDVRLVDAFNNDLSKFPSVRPTGSTAHASIRLSSQEIDLVRYWINVGAPYSDTYGVFGDSGGIGWTDGTTVVDNVKDLPSVQAAGGVIATACAACHSEQRSLPVNAADSMHIAPYATVEPKDGRWSGWLEKDYANPGISTFNRHRVYNLSRPAESLLLRAPLAKEAGGDGMCRKDGVPVFASTDDPQYQALLRSIVDTKARLDKRGRYDQPHFIPDHSWLREMKRYGILPAGFTPDAATFDPRAIEEQYWRGLWWDAARTTPGQWGPEGPTP